MKTFLLMLLLWWALPAQAQWRTAQPGWEYEFPRDHGPHPAFKTEWWYFTGNLSGKDGRRFGYELTFFRQGMRPPGERIEGESKWIANEIALAHFALTDITGQRFFFDHRIGRTTLGMAGFGKEGRMAWIGDWSARLLSNGQWRITARSGQFALDLDLTPQKPPAIHGTNGVSQKSTGAGRASHYYSLSRMSAVGKLRVAGDELAVEGLTWFDREWATNQLTRDQAGWDWFGLHLDDGTDLMLYQLRLKNGGIDPASSGTLVRPDGQVIHLRRDDFQMTPGEAWTSPETGVSYPLVWKITIPGHDIDLRVAPEMRAQEMRVPPAVYWEGAMRIDGVREGRSIRGRGYMELTGYGGEVIGITE